MATSSRQIGSSLAEVFAVGDDILSAFLNTTPTGWQEHTKQRSLSVNEMLSICLRKAWKAGN
ncbi:hypothetical protein HMPREF0758_4651 [Serratia odorifera DSM 4582]|uniref:Uncharacterized protein n=1 Tax=Serratia odorifera DSM 4582 TaxID=667129 RepID=D4E901_SEROD|nr:hypothetical protein HMPREF0758_4651 [Serratia odorifera DSM 4582]